MSFATPDFSMRNCAITLDAGWVACGEKLNRSLCSLKIKLFLDAGGATAVYSMHFQGRGKWGEGRVFATPSGVEIRALRAKIIMVLHTKFK